MMEFQKKCNKAREQLNFEIEKAVFFDFLSENLKKIYLD